MMASFEEEYTALVKAHGIEGAMFVVVQNSTPEEGKGQLMVNLKTILPENDSAAKLMLMALNEVVGKALPQVFGNAKKVELNA